MSQGDCELLACTERTNMLLFIRALITPGDFALPNMAKSVIVWVRFTLICS